MIDRRAIVRAAFEALPFTLDQLLFTHGFQRGSRSPQYTRRTGESVEIIHLGPDFAPPGAYRSHIAALFQPVARIEYGSLVPFVQAMDGPERVREGATTVIAPFHLVHPGKQYEHGMAFWHCHSADELGVLYEDIASYIKQWVLPFLDEFTTPDAFLAGYERADPRLLIMKVTHLHAAAVHLLRGRPRAALEILEQRFQKPGLRSAYAGAFDYVRQQIEEMGEADG